MHSVSEHGLGNASVLVLVSNEREQPRWADDVQREEQRARVRECVAEALVGLGVDADVAAGVLLLEYSAKQHKALAHQQKKQAAGTDNAASGGSFAAQQHAA